MLGLLVVVDALAALSNPVWVVGGSTKLVGEGFAFENEMRSATEVMQEPAEGFSIENPAYDATPLGLVDTVVTDDGAWAP